jgi:chromosome segregation ATPase
MDKKESNKFITESYLDKKLEAYRAMSKKDLESYKATSEELLRSLLADTKQHNSDLKAYFSDSLMGIGEYVKSVDDKVTSLNNQVISLDDKVVGLNNRVICLDDKVVGLNNRVICLDDKVAKIDLDMRSVKSDISLIKDILEEKANKKEVLDLRKRVVSLETSSV